MDAATVADAGHRGLLAGRTVVIPGASARLFAFGSRFVPRGMVAVNVHAEGDVPSFEATMRP